MSNNPHNAPLLTAEIIKTLESVRRLDKDGYLYEMDCAWDYYDEKISRFALEKFGLVRAGCSVFSTNTIDGGALTGRNYDYHHRKFNKPDGEFTGLNVVVHCAPDGKYKSVGIADAFWLDGAGGTMFCGTLDDGKTDISSVAFLPFACMDIMNEKGLTASILSQPVKPGETGVKQDEPGKPKIAHTLLMRYIIDTCATVDEAVKYAQSVNIVSHNGADYRIFISDATGASAALEWRYNKLTVTYTNASTNFFVGFDDCQNREKDGKIYERAVKAENTSREYHYGYGGGYNRFATIVGQLEECRDPNSETYRTVMSMKRAETILRSVTRDAGPDVLSCTQYNAIYDQKKLKLYIRTLPKFEKKYTVKI